MVEQLSPKDLHRQKTNDIILAMVIGLAISAVGLTIFGKLSSEFNLALGALLGYAGNYTYQNMRTAPKYEPPDLKANQNYKKNSNHETEEFFDMDKE